MLKHNPSAATSPNAAIDLTSLLDVIFILLFVVIIAYSESASQKNTKAEGQIQQLTQQLADTQAQLNEALFDEDTLVNSYNASVAQYEELNKAVKKITIYCNYNRDDPSKRVLRIITPEKIYDPISLEPGTDLEKFKELAKILNEYIVAHNPSSNTAQETGQYSSDEACFIVLFLSLKDIQRGDREKIDDIAKTLMENYDNVYYRKFRPDK